MMHGCLNLLEEPTSGHIFFEGTDITDPKTDIDKHRQKMGMVFQQFNLFPNLDIMKNLTIAGGYLLLAITGPGAFSIDRVLNKKW